jgi:hypothetical protein
VKILGTAVCELFIIVQKQKECWFVGLLAVSLHETQGEESLTRGIKEITKLDVHPKDIQTELKQG